MEQIRLNLGCGSKHLPGYVNIDNRSAVNPDVVCNVVEGLPHDDNSVEMVVANDFLEHIHPEKVIFVIEEIHRVLRPGGTFQHSTPSTDGRGAFQDPTHRSFWNINSWMYFTNDAMRDEIETSAKFEVVTLRDVLTAGELGIVHTFGVLRKVVPQ